MTEPKRIRVTTLEQIVQHAEQRRLLRSSVYRKGVPIPAKAWLNKSGKVIATAIKTGLWVHEEKQK